MDESIDVENTKYVSSKHDYGAFFKRFCALAVLVIMLVTVGQASVINGAAQTGERILTLAMGEPIDSPNPFVGITDNAYIFFGMVYDYLMTPDENMINQPNLALDWTPIDGATAASGGTTFAKNADFPLYYNASDWSEGSIWEYTLTDDAFWSDGVQFTAEDVEWTIEIQIGPNFMTYWAYQPYTRWINHVEKVDDYKVRIFFTDYDSKEPTPVAFGGNIFIPMMPKHIFEGKPTSYLGQEWDGYPAIGTGVFKGTANLRQEIIAKEAVTMVKNGYYNYTEDGVAHGVGVTQHRDIQIDKLIMKFYSEESTLAVSIKTGDTDVGEVLPGTYLQWAADPTLPDNIILQKTLSPTSYSKEVVLNDYSSSPGSLNALRLDPAVQRACALATDKEYIQEVVYKGLADIGYGLITPVTPDWYWEPDTTPSTFNVYDQFGSVIYTYTLPLNEVMMYDIDRANAILSAAGYVWDNSSGLTVRKASQLAAERMVAMGFANDVPSVLNKKLIFEHVVEQEVFEDKQVGDFLVGEWEKIGVWISSKADGSEHAVSLVGTATWNQLVYGYLYNTMQTYWSADIDPNYICYIPTSYALYGWNEFGTNETSYDTLYLDTVTALDPVVRRQYVNETQEWIYLSGSIIVTVYPVICFAMNNETWEGWGNWSLHPGMTEDAFWSENPLWWHLKFKESSTTTTGDMTGAIIAGIVVIAIVAAIAATMLLRRRKKEKMLLEEEEPEEEEKD